MLIFVYGDDAFRSREKVRGLEDAFRKKFDPAGMNLAAFPAEGRTLEAGEVLQAALSFPFMTAKRMVIVRDLVVHAKKDEAAVWEEQLKRLPETTILVLWETGETAAVEKKPLFKALAKGAEVHAYPFPLLEGPALAKWAAQRFAQRGAQADAGAVRELCARVGADLWRMDAEIAKLVAYRSGRPVAQKDVEDLVRPSFEGEIFALMDSLSGRRGPDALKRLREEREAGAEDFQLFAMLSRQVRLLLAARAALNEGMDKAAFAAEMGVHPFVAQKSLQQARAFSLDELRALHDRLFALDLEMKTGGCEAEIAVDLVSSGFFRP